MCLWAGLLQRVRMVWCGSTPNGLSSFACRIRWCGAMPRIGRNRVRRMGSDHGESPGKRRPELRSTSSSGRVTGLRGLMCRSATGDDVPAIFLILFPYILFF
jgi:hypothetical protein